MRMVQIVGSAGSGVNFSCVPVTASGRRPLTEEAMPGAGGSYTYAVPRQDAQGRWLSDDGLQYWDGNAWRPLGPQAPAKSRSALPAILIGCGFVLVVLLVLFIGFIALVFNNSSFQRSFCNGWESSNSNIACPFQPSS
jgi:hypothetical protein